jgi:Tat protein secretion system quality control protein TatD with DNase activity
LCCWELIRLSLTEDLYNRCGKTNVIPFAYPYNGDSSDVFSDEDVVTIMNAYTKFLHVVFREVRKNGRTHLCSQAVLDRVTSLLGGKKEFRTYVNENPNTFFSVPISERKRLRCNSKKADEIETSCHPEFLLNKLYLNMYTGYHALRWDYMYTQIRRYLVDTSSACTVGNDIILESGVSFDLLKLAEQERNERNSQRQMEKMRMGTHSFQNHARKMLNTWGIHIPDDANVLSMYEKEKMKRGIHPWQVHARNMLNAWNISIPDDANVLSLYQSVVQKTKMKDGVHPFQIHAAEMLDMMGVEIPIGGNVLSMYQKELLALGVHPWQVYARKMLNDRGISIPDDANVLSLFQEELMKRDKHNFQVYAKKMLEMMGVEVLIGGNVLSIYQKELLALGVHPWQVYARKMLNAWNISIPDDADVWSMYQEKLVKDNKHSLQKYAAEMLAIMGVEVPIDGNVISIYQKELMALGLNPLQNLSEESTDKKNINNRLTNMAQGLPEWNKSFADFLYSIPRRYSLPKKL